MDSFAQNKLDKKMSSSVLIKIKGHSVFGIHLQTWPGYNVYAAHPKFKSWKQTTLEGPRDRSVNAKKCTCTSTMAEHSKTLRGRRPILEQPYLEWNKHSNRT
jgi:hypothetical protein